MNKDYRMKKAVTGKKHYYVRVERKWVEVEKAVYLLFANEDRKKRRRIKKEQEMGIEFLSYNQLIDDYEADDSTSAFIPAALLTRSAEDVFFDNEEYSDDAEFLEWFVKKSKSFPIDKRILLQALAESEYSGRDFAERMGVPNSSMNIYIKAEFRQLVQQYYQEVGR